MKKKSKKEKDKTKADLAPENFNTQEEHAAAVEEYTKSQPINTYFQFFFGDNNIDKNKQSGKPPTY